ncbi:MAG: hypothetical protein MI806_16655 [Minwuiales bacterium]|nr:hypothetical protein [Minwuiales bacterium]
MKRFYKQVETAEEAGGYAVTLDGRPIRTPAKAALLLPSPGLAEAVAAEWREQGETVQPADMPIMRLASTAIDRVAGRREEVVDTVAAFGGSDLLCYRAEGPAELAARQAAAWQPLLDWLAERHGVALSVTAGIVHVQQSAESLAALRSIVAGYDDFALTALHTATAACGSLVVGLALVDGRLGPDEAFQAGQVDEAYQAEKWGEDAEAAKARRILAAEIEAAARFVDLL